MAKVIGIGGVLFRSADRERLYGWYERYLGIRRDPAKGVTFPWRRADEPGRAEQTAWSLFKEDTKYFGPTNPAFMVNYIVEDLDGFLDALRAEGQAVDDRVEDTEYGHFGWVADPDGNRLELWEPPRQPPVAPIG